MIAIDIRLVKAIQANFAVQILAQYDVALTALKAIDIKKINNAVYKKYLKDLITVFEDNADIITANPDELLVLKEKFGELAAVTLKQHGSKAVAQRKSFVEKIQKAIGYKRLRDEFYPMYFSEIGVKSCVYCNSQLAVTVYEEKGKYGARFDVDHFTGKNRYPGLAISLFNLFPACAPCNRRKSQSGTGFQLYSEKESDLKESMFVFKLDAHAKARYLLHQKDSVIDFALHDRLDGTLASAHDKLFGINSIYRTQRDVAQELMIKSQIYDQSYKKVLRHSFSLLRISDADIERMIIGSYSREGDIHRRPLSKFIRDISIELGLIGNDDG